MKAEDKKKELAGKIEKAKGGKEYSGARSLAKHITQTSAKSALASEAKGDRARIAKRDSKIDSYFKKAGIK